MAELFTEKHQLTWALALAAALFFPVRHLIWVLYVRRAEAKGEEADDAGRLALKKRAGITAALLSFVFAYFYTTHMF